MQGRFDIREYLTDQGTRLNFLAKALLDADVPSILNFLERNLEVTSLNLENQKLLSLAAIEMLLGCRTLREINLSHIASDRISHLALAKTVKKILRLNTDLKILHLTHNNFNDASMTVIFDGIRKNNQLTHLFAGNNLAGFDSQYVIYQALRLNTTLQVLHMNHNKIACNGARYFAFGCMFNSSIREINLCGNAIGDTGAIHIAEYFTGKKSLVILLLRHNQISSHGVRFLTELFRVNLTLTKIDFSNAYVKEVLERPALVNAEVVVQPVAAARLNDGGNNNNAVVVDHVPAENPYHAQPAYVANEFEGAVTPSAPSLEWFDDEIAVREVTHIEAVEAAQAAYDAAPQAEPPVAAPVHNHHANLWNRPPESESDDYELESEEDVASVFKIEFS